MAFLKNRKKHATIGLAGVAAIIALPAAGSAFASANAAAAASGNLSVQIQVTQNSLVDCYIKQYKKTNPNVNVTTSVVGALAKGGTNLEVLTGSNPPDVGFVPNNSAVYARMLAEHDLYPLTAVWTADKLAAAYGPANAQLEEQGGVPYVVSEDSLYYGVVYYNLNDFAKAHVAPPSNHRFASLAQMNATVKKLTAAGFDGLSVAGDSGYELGWMIDNFMNTSTTPKQYVNYLTSWNKGVSMTYNYTSAPFERALEAIAAMGKANDFEPGYLGITQGAEGEALFSSGQAAMRLDGDWWAASIKGFPYSWALLPPVPGSSEPNQLSQAAADDYGIPVGAKDKTNAENFLEVLASPAGQMCNLENGILPGIPMPAKDYKALPVAVQQMVSFADKYGAQTGWTSGLPGNLAQTFADPLVVEMLGGQLTVAQVAEKIQANILANK
jgi:ABC-type glycerol-3-phosphate transport system substrate-binding protein